MEDYRGAEQGRSRRARPLAFLLRGDIVESWSLRRANDRRRGRRLRYALVHIEMRWLNRGEDRFRANHVSRRSMDEDQKGIGFQSALVFENAVLGNAHAVDRGAGGAKGDSALDSGKSDRGKRAKRHDRPSYG